MKLMNSLFSGVTFAFALSLAGPAVAQDCPRGDLDNRYCDVNGDLVADTPTDPADQVDPDRKSTRLNSSHGEQSRMPSSA